MLARGSVYRRVLVWYDPAYSKSDSVAMLPFEEAHGWYDTGLLTRMVAGNENDSGNCVYHAINYSLSCNYTKKLVRSQLAVHIPYIYRVVVYIYIYKSRRTGNQNINITMSSYSAEFILYKFCFFDSMVSWTLLQLLDW